MTPMSDVMVLLLTFFMLTSTFVKNEAVKVVRPGSVSEVKVTDSNVLTILIDDKGKVFLGWDKPGDMETALGTMADQFGVSLGAKMKNVRSATNIGVSMEDMSSFLDQDASQMNAFQQDKGVPTDSIDGGMSEFQLWVKTVTDANSDMKLAIKADEKTPYKVIKKVMSELQDMDQNRYELITSYKKVEE